MSFLERLFGPSIFDRDEENTKLRAAATSLMSRAREAEFRATDLAGQLEIERASHMAVRAQVLVTEAERDRARNHGAGMQDVMEHNEKQATKVRALTAQLRDLSAMHRHSVRDLLAQDLVYVGGLDPFTSIGIANGVVDKAMVDGVFSDTLLREALRGRYLDEMRRGLAQYANAPANSEAVRSLLEILQVKRTAPTGN